MSTPPTAPTYADANPVNNPRCTRVVYALLGFFLGTFGVHNFVAGHKKKALIQLGLGAGGFVLSFVLIGLPMMLAAWVWAIVDIFTVTADGDGVAFDGSGVSYGAPAVTSGSPIPNVSGEDETRKAA